MKTSDLHAIIPLAICGLLIVFRFAFYYPANLGDLFDFAVHTQGSTTLLFFVWNLFLATLPYFFSRLSEQFSSRWIIGFFLLLWLLFLPNAPYVISDLKHLRPRTGVPYFFDVFTFGYCALTGLYLGGLAVVNVMRQLNWKTWSPVAKVFSLLVFPLSGFGIFLGRVLRWNSWDAFSRPTYLLVDILENLTNKGMRPTIILFVFGYGLALLFGTIVVKKVVSNKNHV